MRLALFLVPLSLIALAACGTTEEKTVIVKPAPGSTVVVDIFKFSIPGMWSPGRPRPGNFAGGQGRQSLHGLW